MADEKDRSPEQNDILKKLRAIGGDFWGDSPAEPAPAAAEAPKAKKPAEKKPGIDQLWMTADETVDWTDALAYDQPRDGLTAPGLWRFYHENARQVLTGDVQAYAQVLRRTNPLSELTIYCDGLTMRAPSAERLEASFTCRPKLVQEKEKLYLAALGVRIARDLLACLPVEEAGVQAWHEGRIVFTCTYPREKLLHRNYRFLDPIAFSEECGATFSL